MTNTKHGLVKTAPARDLSFLGTHINLHSFCLFICWCLKYIYIYVRTCQKSGKVGFPVGPKYGKIDILENYVLFLTSTTKVVGEAQGYVM